MKKTILITALGLLFSQLAFTQEALLGKWLTQNKDGVVEIYEKDDKYFGRIVELIPATLEDGSQIIDQHNPDKSKRNRPVKGIDIIIGFEWNGEELENGKVYDPNDGKFYKGKIWIDEGELKMRGYLGLFYRTETWTKYK